MSSNKAFQIQRVILSNKVRKDCSSSLRPSCFEQSWLFLPCDWG